MKLQDQVITLDQAKSLKELGIIQKSLFYHHPAFERPAFGEQWTTEFGKTYKKCLVCNDKKGSASAFTVAELGVMLPAGYDTMRTTQHPDDLWFGYDTSGNFCPAEKCWKTEAEARGAMLIHLLETYSITAEEVNTRLKA